MILLRALLVSKDASKQAGGKESSVTGMKAAARLVRKKWETYLLGQLQ